MIEEFGHVLIYGTIPAYGGREWGDSGQMPNN